jgi:hypothetical protein
MDSISGLTTQLALETGILALNEAISRRWLLGQNLDASNLATTKVFLCFVIATSSWNLNGKSTSHSVNAFAE